MTAARRKKLAGVSLIEALLALVVMSLGMLAVAGVQSTLRSNADLSRQRAEALRLAEESLDEWRSFSSLAGTGITYAAIASDGPIDVTPPGSNTTFRRTRVVTDTGVSPPSKTVAVTVEWDDRAGTAPAPNVQLFTTIARVAAEVSGSLSVLPHGGGAIGQPMGRHGAIPKAAISLPDGTSEYAPPNQPINTTPITLYFDNATGFITRVCQPAPCVGTNELWLPISGNLRSVAGNPTSAPNLGDPSGPATAFFGSDVVGVAIPDWSDGTTRSVLCFIDPPGPSNAMAYLCAVPVQAGVPWTGTLTFSLTTGNTPYNVCRYAPLAPPLTAGKYTGIDQPMATQNFLALGSVLGTLYSCPTPLTGPYQTLP